jgi:hypothetical protein
MSASAAASVRPLPAPARDAWDALILGVIFLGLLFLLWLSIATPLMDPLLEAARQGRWGHLLVRPTVIWIAMGSLLLDVRTAMWLRYRPGRRWQRRRRRPSRS